MEREDRWGYFFLYGVDGDCLVPSRLLAKVWEREEDSEALKRLELSRT